MTMWKLLEPMSMAANRSPACKGGKVGEDWGMAEW